MYKFIENEKEIEVKPERWGWGVVYNDGTELKQFGDDGIFHRVGEIDQDKISMAVLYRLDDESKRIDIPWRVGMRLIHKYINFHAHYFDNVGDTVKIYVIGFKHGKNYGFNYVLPDDRIIMTPVEDVDLSLFNIKSSLIN